MIDKKINYKEAAKMAKKPTIEKYDNDIEYLQKQIKKIQQEKTNFINKKYQEIGKLFCKTHYGSGHTDIFDEIIEELQKSKKTSQSAPEPVTNTDDK